MVGDILTTSNTPDQEQAIPTLLGSVNHRLPPDQKALPFRLRRKIYIINDQLAVGLAGSVYQMKEFLSDLKTRFKIFDVTGPRIQAFLDEFSPDVYPDIAVVLLHAAHTPQGIAIDYYYFGAWRVQSTSLFGDVLACGSGSPDFLKQAGQEWTIPALQLRSDLTRAISANYSLLGNILGQERLSLSTIRKRWGAGFEMIYFDGERFRNMDDITIVLWKGALDVMTGKFEIAPLTFLNYHYTNDKELLIIDAADATGIHSYGALPIDMRPEDVDKTTLPTAYHFDARRICFTYVLEVAARETIGNETIAHIASPTFYLEKDPNEEPAFLPDGAANPFRSTRSDSSIPNMGAIKVDISPDGTVNVVVQEGIHEMVIDGLRRTLLAQLGSDGQLPSPPISD
jgi:hypothetical protein